MPGKKSPPAPTVAKKKPLFADDSAPSPSAASTPSATQPAQHQNTIATQTTPSSPSPPGQNVPSAGDPLGLAELFVGGESWLPILKPVLEKLPKASTFVGASRDHRIVPVRELTFQALKPNPPEQWKVVIFGQTPYPRVESAVGISMFDNAFHTWQDPRFIQCASMRNMLKAAVIWKQGVSTELPPKELTGWLAKENVVPPEQWFQAMLSQGVLLIDTSLTRSADDSIPVAQHVEFWAPVAKAIVEAILSAKETAAPEHRGVIFAWWGAHARDLRTVVEQLAAAHPSVPIRHVNHLHPAARTKGFCEGNHYQKLNDALTDLGATPVDWLPSPGWQERSHTDADTAQHMGGFIKETMDLHKVFLERLQGAAHEKIEELPSIDGVMGTPILSFDEAASKVSKLMPTLGSFVSRSLGFAKTLSPNISATLSADEIAALYLYTTASPLYRQLNAELRNQDRSRIAPYFAYLRLFLAALSKLPPSQRSLYRGVNADLKKQYVQGSTITWWGVSSCTPSLSVAQGFLGGSGARMLFEVLPAAAYSIQRFSAFTSEEEYILVPGSRLLVEHVEHGAGGFSKVKLRELAGQSQLS